MANKHGTSGKKRGIRQGILALYDGDDSFFKEASAASRAQLMDDEAAEDDDVKDYTYHESASVDSTPPGSDIDEDEMPGASSIGVRIDSRSAPRRGERRAKAKTTSSSVDPDAGPKTFPQFARLPAELRIRIWEMHCPSVLQTCRVIQVVIEDKYLMTPWVTMERYTRPLRQFMRIARETRAMGLRVVPDVLPLQLDKWVMRFNAENDILHILDDNDYTGEIYSAAPVDPQFPELPRYHTYAHVRNIAIHDLEPRTREAGVYLDYDNGLRVIDIMAPHHVSHKKSGELRMHEVVNGFLELFPKLNNVYVVERAVSRRINAWVGDTRPGNHQTHRIHTREGHADEGPWRHSVDYIHCWHDPPAAWVKQRREDRAARAIRKKAEKAAREARMIRRNAEKAEKAVHTAETQAAEGDGDGDSGSNNFPNDYEAGFDSSGDIGFDSDFTPEYDDDDMVIQPNCSDKTYEWEFEPEVILNHMALFRHRGVRFSRMLLFEMQQGLDIYRELRRDCKPHGVWPLKPNGRPMQDDPPMDELDDDELEEAMEEYENVSWIDDDEQQEEDDGSSNSDDDDDDGDEIFHDDDSDAAAGPAADVAIFAPANFSSPESEAPPTNTKGGGRGKRKRRRVVDDSDDEEEEGEGSAPKRPTLVELLTKGREEHPLPGSDEEDEDEDAGDYGLQGEEDEDEDEDDDEDEDEDNGDDDDEDNGDE